jgi:glycine/D-amino acid oxidase-like deaminating enzyme
MIKGASVIRPVFKNNTTELKGIMCHNGVILADYLVVASDYSSFNRTKYLGTRLPISNSTLHSDKEENPEFRFGVEMLKWGKTVVSETKLLSKTANYMPRNVELTPDNRPVVGRNPYSHSVFFNFGYGGWQTGLAFWAAQEIGELIADKDLGDKAEYSPKRFIQL